VALLESQNFRQSRFSRRAAPSRTLTFICPACGVSRWHSRTDAGHDPVRGPLLPRRSAKGGRLGREVRRKRQAPDRPGVVGKIRISEKIYAAACNWRRYRRSSPTIHQWFSLQKEIRDHDRSLLSGKNQSAGSVEVARRFFPTTAAAISQNGSGSSPTIRAVAHLAGRAGKAGLGRAAVSSGTFRWLR